MSSCSTTASFEPKYLFMICQDSNSLKHHLLQWNNDLWDNDSKIIISVKHWKTEPLSNYLIFCCYHNQVNCPKGSIFKTWNLSHPWTMCSPSPTQWDRTIQPIPLKKELSAFCSKSHYTHFCSEDGKYCLQKRIFLTYNHCDKKNPNKSMWVMEN